MNLILSLEEEFSVSFSDEEIMKISSIKDIIRLLKEKGVPDEKL
jgi:acyl carrier protein